MLPWRSMSKVIGIFSSPYRWASAVLLTATSTGLASCPVTEPLETPDTREAVRSDIFGDSNYPQMLLRVGWAPINADPLPATPRRELDDFVEWTT